MKIKLDPLTQLAITTIRLPFVFGEAFWSMWLKVLFPTRKAYR